MAARESSILVTKSERREQRRKNSRKHGVSGRSFLTSYENAIIKRSKGNK